MRRRSSAFARWAGLLLCVAGPLALLGWILDVERLRSLLAGGVAMNPLTALCLTLLGVALAREARRTGASRDRIATGLAALAAALAALRLLAYLGAPDLGLDRLFFADQLAAYEPPNRMAPNTALALVVAAAALILVRARDERVVAAGQLAALGAGTAGAVTMLGYAFGLSDLAGLRAYIPMAFPTGASLAVLGAGVLLCRTDAGLVRSAAADTAGGQTFRRVAPVAVLMPPLLAWLGVNAVAAGVMSAGLAISLAAIINTVVLVVLIGLSARSHERVEYARVEADARTRAVLRDLRRKSAELGAANEELESFSYSVSHDLRAPLRSIISFSQVLLEDYGATLDAEARAHLDRITRAGTRMSMLIDDMIGLARASRGELQRSDVDVSALALEVVEELQLAEPLRDVEVRIEPGLEASADARLVRAVLANLIGNAWKYTSKATHATIDVGALPRTDASGISNGPIAFFVRDNGIGFDMQYARRLFTPFQRLHRDEEYSGSGIGLATVRRIIHRHGGRIWAESAPGSGATFFFTLNPELDG